MTTTRTITRTCDLCGYGGPLARPERFTHYDNGVDLCHWCSQPRGRTLITECGRHSVTLTDDGWSCSCGSSRTLATLRLLVPERVLAVVPSIVQATALAHSEEP